MSTGQQRAFSDSSHEFRLGFGSYREHRQSSRAGAMSRHENRADEMECLMHTGLRSDALDIIWWELKSHEAYTLKDST